MTATFDTYLDSLAPGEKPDAASFARSAIGELPRITTPAARLNPKIWGEGVGEESDAALGEQGEGMHNG